MARSTPWRAILAMPANSGAIQWEVTLYTVTECLFISAKVKDARGFIPLALLIYIARLQLLQRWTALYHPIDQAWHPDVCG